MICSEILEILRFFQFCDTTFRSFCAVVYCVFRFHLSAIVFHYESVRTEQRKCKCTSSESTILPSVEGYRDSASVQIPLTFVAFGLFWMSSFFCGFGRPKGEPWWRHWSPRVSPRATRSAHTLSCCRKEFAAIGGDLFHTLFKPHLLCNTQAAHTHMHSHSKTWEEVKV